MNPSRNVSTRGTINNTKKHDQILKGIFNARDNFLNMNMTNISDKKIKHI
jgi:hypothetical protein